MIRLKSLLFEDALPKSVVWAKQFKNDLGLTDVAAAAMAANIQHESGFIASRIQGDVLKTGTLADSGGLGYSWAQWTFGARKENFRDHVLNKFKVDIKKTPATDKHAYDFLKNEIVNYPGFDFDKFKRSTNLEQATEDFVTNYEQAGKPMLASRIEIAKEILNAIKAPIKSANPKAAAPAGATSSLKGKTVYPVKTSESDITNVRNEPVINNGVFTNIITKVQWPNPIGVIKYIKRDDKLMTWYYVQLSKELTKSMSNRYDYGWVRFDAVTTNKNEKYV
jgi:hypothetical protein